MSDVSEALLETKMTQITAAQEARLEETQYANPRVTTFSTYFGDTLISVTTRTMTFTPREFIPSECISNLFLERDDILNPGTWNTTEETKQIVSWEEVWNMSRDQPGARFFYKATHPAPLHQDRRWQQAYS